MPSAIKCVVVGDGTVGKTSMIMSFVENKYPEQYLPTVFDHTACDCIVSGQLYTLGLWDTSGQYDYDRIRPLSYPATDVFLICFSLCNQNSFENVKTKWYPEVAHFSVNVPIILVGTKSDQCKQSTKLTRRSIEEKQISWEEGSNLAQKIKASSYLECSALTQIGLKEVFHEAIRVTLQPIAPKKRDCSIL